MPIEIPHKVLLKQNNQWETEEEEPKLRSRPVVLSASISDDVYGASMGGFGGGEGMGGGATMGAFFGKRR
jgi:hypothetical protein